MANTYNLIASNILTTATASVSFSSIPATYTDLLVRVSERSSAASILSIVTTQYNASGGTAYSYLDIDNNGGGAGGGASNLGSAGASYRSMYQNGNSTVANTFGSAELYIPNYAGSAYKVATSFSVSTDNVTNAYTYLIASLWQSTAAITSVSFTPTNGTFSTGSSFYLYGIKNS